MKTFETYLPIFTGFYNTVFEADEEQEVFCINEERENNGLKEVDYNKIKWDYKVFERETAIACCNSIEEKINDILDTKCKITFQEVVSPREYNFSNDSINIGIEIDFNKLLDYINDNMKEFEVYIKDNYTSHDGFVSFNSNNAIEWILETKESHKIGSMLQFVLENEEYKPFDLYEDITCTGNIVLEASNYTELTEA